MPPNGPVSQMFSRNNSLVSRSSSHGHPELRRAHSVDVPEEKLDSPDSESVFWEEDQEPKPA